MDLRADSVRKKKELIKFGEDLLSSGLRLHTGHQPVRGVDEILFAYASFDSKVDPPKFMEEINSEAVLEQAEKDSRNLLQKVLNSCHELAIRSAIGLLKEADRKIDKVGEILDWGIRFMHLQREGVGNDKKVSKEEAEFVEQSSFVTICKDAIHKTIANWEKNLTKRVLRMNDQRLKQKSGKDLKRKLHEIFDEDWNSIPEGEDFSSLNRNRAEELALTLDAIPISGSRAIDPEVYLAGLRFEDELRSFNLDSRRNM